jgi:hypothetical protein
VIGVAGLALGIAVTWLGADRRTDCSATPAGATASPTLLAGFTLLVSLAVLAPAGG